MLAHKDPAARILEWLLITVRSWDVSALEPERDFLRADVEIWFSGLTREIEPVLRQVNAQCASTKEAIRYAREITAILKRYAQFLEQQQAQSGGQQGAQVGVGSDSSGQQSSPIDPAQALQSLRGLLSANESGLPSDMGGQIREAITGVCTD